MVLSPVGQAVADAWCWLAEKYDYVMLGAWTIMPNHIHGRIELEWPIKQNTSRSKACLAPTSALDQREIEKYPFIENISQIWKDNEMTDGTSIQPIMDFHVII